MYPLKQSSALTVPFFAHDVNGDGVTGLVDAGFTKRISKNGAAFGAMTVTITEMENGWYSLPLSTAHTDTLGILTISISHGSAKRVNIQFRVHARINDDYAYPAVSGRSSAIDASGRHLADVDTIKSQAVTASGGITFPAATLASTVNITAASGIAVSSLGANVITAASINAAALNGKGDWNIGKTGYSLLATTGLGNQTANITGNLSGSVGSVTAGVTVTTNNDKTGYSLTQAFPTNFASLSITAAGLVTLAPVTHTGAVIPTVSAVTGLNAANLDAAVSTRLPTSSYVAPDNAGIAANGTAIAGVQADTDDIQTRLPAALVGGRMDSSVGAVAANAITAAAIATDAVDADALATDAVNEIVNAIPNAPAGASAINVRADGFVLTTGVETGTFADTHTLNGVFHQLDDTLDVIDGYYTFNVGLDGVPVGVSFSANVQSTNDTITVSGWKWETSTWEEVGTIPGSGSTALQDFTFPLFVAHAGKGADLGKVRVRVSILSGGTNPHLDVDLLFVSYSVIPISNVLHSGGVASATPTTLVLDATGPTGDTLFPALVMVTSPTGVSQSRRAESYTGATKTFVVATPWTVTPDSTYTVKVFSWASVRVSDIDTSPKNEIRDAILPPKNAAFADVEFLMVDSTDHVTPKTALTITATRSIDGGAFGAKDAGTIIAEVGNGVYQIDIAAADMNGKIITWRFTAAGADDRFLTIVTGG